MIQRLVAALAIALAVWAPPGGASALACPGYGSAADHVTSVDLVFTGRVLSTDEGMGSWGRQVLVRFQVTKVFKGHALSTVNVVTMELFGVVDFLPGEDYLVFAFGAESLPPGGLHMTDTCIAPRFSRAEYENALGSEIGSVRPFSDDPTGGL